MTNPPELVPREVLAEFEGCEGERINRQLRALKVAGRIVGTNAKELRDALQDLNRPEVAVPLWSDKNRKLLTEYHREVIRLLHNYLASVATYRDHTRAFLRRNYESTPFFLESSARAAEVFGSSTVVSFLMGLRNYTLHNRLPLTTARLTLGNPAHSGRSEATIVLELEALKAWDRWAAPARRFLAEQTDDIRLLPLIEECERRQFEFAGWLRSRLLDLHAEAFAEAQRLHARVVEAFKL